MDNLTSILSEVEQLNDSDLAFLFEYIVEQLNARKDRRIPK